MNRIVDFESVSYYYPDSSAPALKDVNLTVAEGEFLAMMGKNGAGKTTFCKLINGIIPHSYGGRLTGIVTVDGRNTSELTAPQLAQKAGLVFDDPDAQLFTSSVRYEAAFGPENLNLPENEIEDRVKQALGAVGLLGFENRQPSTLSGGEKQRLAIAAALAMKTKILVLDEPLCRLDTEGAAGVMAVLKDLRLRFGLTVIMAAGESNFVSEFADRVCIFNNGCIAACDTPQKIFSNYALLGENGIKPPDKLQIEDIFTTNFKNHTNDKKDIAIQIKSFSYSYGSNTILNNLNLTINDNDFMAIMGPNGCGKTSLLKCITGLLRPPPASRRAQGFASDPPPPFPQPSAGIFIRWKNINESQVSDISTQIGYVMQNPDNQLFTDSVFKEVSFALKNYGFSKTEIQKRAEEALLTVDFHDNSAFPHALSRADRTRVVIACVLAMGCKIIIFDEVDVGQDYQGSLKIMNIAKELYLKGYTIIFVTHNIFLACEYANRLIMMEKNGIIKDMRRKDER